VEKMITGEQRENVRYRIEEEGMNYTFEGYSHFPYIEDEHFHKLRKEYLAAADKLKDYVR